MSSASPVIDEETIHRLVHAFYGKVRADAALGPIFDRVIRAEWDTHLAKMCDFWSSVMLTTGRYHGNPMAAHLKLEGVAPAHFQRWLALFRETAAEVCDAQTAALFASRAENIARSLQMGMFWRAGQAAMRALPVVALLGAFTLAALPGTRAQDKPPSNAVEALQKQLDAGTASLDYAQDGHGYVPALLQAFHIPRDSQLLVLSASSLQFDRIGPKTPRALYYQDNVALGTVLDGRLIEIMATDRDSGVAFYTLDTAKSDKPRFERRTGECIICHGFASRWAPGMMVANMDTGPDGKPLNLDPAHLFRLTDQRTPFADRYGGWYVTGQTGAMPHRGNVTLDPSDPLTLPPPPNSDVTGEAPQLIQLPTQLRGRGLMTYDDELDGFAGNYDELDIGSPPDAFPRRHQVTAPEVPAEHRDEFTAETARTYRVLVPNDLLEL